MNKMLWTQAESLAAQNWATRVYRDVLSDGTQVLIAECPELPGCKIQVRGG